MANPTNSDLEAGAGEQQRQAVGGGLVAVVQLQWCTGAPDASLAAYAVSTPPRPNSTAATNSTRARRSHRNRHIPAVFTTKGPDRRTDRAPYDDRKSETTQSSSVG
jgi:hypothetical protein